MRYSKYNIKQGDTIQGIAQAYYNDMSRWQEIVTYNNLKYPYIVSTPNISNNHVLSVGDELIIPIESDGYSLNDLALRNQDLEVITSYALGRDLALVDSRDDATKVRGATDELFNLQDATGDVKTVYGHDNLIQAIILRLSTKKGTMPLHPDYGTEFYTLLGQRVTYDLINKLQVMMKTTINEEPRVKENSVTITSKDAVNFDVVIHVNPIDTEEQIQIALNLISDGSVILK